MTLLAAEPLGLRHGDALKPDLLKRLLHLVELEGFDDRFDLLHRALRSRRSRSDLDGRFGRVSREEGVGCNTTAREVCTYSGQVA